MRRYPVDRPGTSYKSKFRHYDEKNLVDRILNVPHFSNELKREKKKTITLVVKRLGTAILYSVDQRDCDKRNDRVGTETALLEQSGGCDPKCNDPVLDASDSEKCDSAIPNACRKVV